MLKHKIKNIYVIILVNQRSFLNNMIKELKNVKTLLEDGYAFCDIRVEDGKFSKIVKNSNDKDQESDTFIIPGFVDEHTHGGDGIIFIAAIIPVQIVLQTICNHSTILVRGRLNCDAGKTVLGPAELLGCGQGNKERC